MQHPLGEKVLVRINKEEKKSEAGIILSGAEETFLTVTIEKISPDIKDRHYKEGDTCLCEKGGVEVEPTLFLIRESQLVAVI